MTSRLDEIRNALAEYWRTQHALGSMDRTRATDFEHELARSDLANNAPYYLQELLAVCEAAVGYMSAHEAVLAVWENARIEVPDDMRRFDEAKANLLQAVAKLTADSGGEA